MQEAIRENPTLLQFRSIPKSYHFLKMKNVCIFHIPLRSLRYHSKKNAYWDAYTNGMTAATYFLTQQQMLILELISDHCVFNTVCYILNVMHFLLILVCKLKMSTCWKVHIVICCHKYHDINSGSIAHPLEQQ